MPIILIGGGPIAPGAGGTKFSRLIQVCAEEMGEGQWPLVSTATADGDADSLIDAAVSDSRTDPEDQHPVDIWVRLTISGVENIRKIKTFTASSGTYIPQYSFTGAPGIGTEYEVHRVMNPHLLKRCIIDALAELRYQEILPLTLVVDGDMLGAAAATYWGTVTASIDYDTTKVLFGTRSLYVQASAADGYAYPKSNVAVTPGERLIVWASVYGDQQQAELILYDVTNSADIPNASARHDEEGWGLLFFTATVPSGCYEVRPHLRTKTNGGTTYWDHVGILKANERVYDSPTWLSKKQDFIKIVSFPRGGSLSSDNASNAYSLWRYGPQHEHTEEIIYAHRGLVPLRLELGERPSKPLFVIGKRRYPALSVDTDETEADEATVKAGALAFAYRRLGDDYEAQARKWAGIFNDLRRADEPPITVRQHSYWRR